MNRTTRKTTFILGMVLILAIIFVMAFALVPNSKPAAHAETEYTVVWDKEVLKTFPDYAYNQELASIADAASNRTITLRSVNGYVSHNTHDDEVYDEVNDWYDYITIYDGAVFNNDHLAKGFTFSINNPSETSVTIFTKIEIKGEDSYFYNTPDDTGWSCDDSNAMWTGKSSIVDFDVEGYVQNVYEIKFTFKIVDGFVTTLNTNGGTINRGNVTFYETGVGATLPTDVTKNGYGFKGWYDNAAFDGDPVTAIGTDATGAKEFWAKWLPTVTLNTNDGVINSGEITEYIEGVGATLPTDVTKDNCTFGGWYDNAIFDGDPVTAIGTDATGGKTYWAKWICSVTLNTNGGTINSGDVTEYAEGVGATLPTDVTKEDVFFAGWYDNASFEGDPVTTIGTNDRGPKEYWAKYLDHIHEYSSDWSYDDSKHWHACTSTKGVCDAPVIDEAAHTFAESMDTTAFYACVCGYEDAERKNTFYNTAGTFEIDTNTKQWSYKKQNVTIQVQDLGDNNGSYVNDSKSMTVTVKGNVVIKEITVTVGYVFYGGGDTLASAGSKSGNTFSGINAKTVKVYSNGRMLLKHFSVETTPVNGITYELNGGTINEKIDVDYYDYYFNNQGRTLPTNVTRADYIFQGWYDNANFEGDSITAIPTGVTGNKTVWAKWKPTIIYNVTGGEIQDAEYATEFTPGVGATLPTTVTKDGYSFGGWYDNEDLEGVPVATIGTEVTETQTYWAKWYTVGYYFVGNTTDNKVTEECLLTKNTAETEIDEYYIDLHLSALDTFKVIYGTVVYGEEGRKDTLYPSGTGNEYVVPVNGLYRVFFRPNADGGAGWHENVLYAKRLFAEIGTDRYYSLAEAYDAVSANGTIKLLDDVDLTSAALLVVTKNVTLDLNGYILDITTVANPTSLSDFKIVATRGAVITLDDTNDTIGGVKGICYPDAGSYIVLGNCRLDMDAMLVRANVAINHKLEGYVVRDIDAGNPDADGFVTIVRPGTDEEIAADVDEWIGFIGEVQATVASKTKINTARSEYEALTAAQKELVSNLATLEADESTYITKVVGTIVALPAVGVLVYENKATVENARALYEALREEEKEAFDEEKFATLVAAEADMEELKTAKAAEVAIDALPLSGTLTFADCDDLVRARIRYDALTDYQRSKISEDRHTELTTKLEALELEATYCHAAEVVNVQIDELPLPEDIMPWNQSRIESARAAYDALTDEEKAKVVQSTMDKLEAAEAALAVVGGDLAAATGVADVISAIGYVEFTVESHDRILTARTQYDALTDNRKRFVDNYATLTSAEAKYLQLKSDHDSDATAAAIDLINAIGTVENTPECEGKITKARDAFDALTAGQKEFVTNYETLENAEIAYAAYTPVENVAKIEENGFTSLLAACEAARTGDVVKLMADIDLSTQEAAYITLRRDITIDLNGHVLNVTSDPLTYKVWASDGAIITIDNSVPAKGGVKGIVGADYLSGANIVLHSCRLTLSIEELSKYGAFISLDNDCVIMDINEGNPSVIGYTSIVYPIGDADYAAAVDELIDAIGAVEYTDECQQLILSAREEYEALTDDQQYLISNLATLEEAESDYAALAAAKIEALIADEITVVEKANIEAARAIYDSLNDQQQACIPATFDKLHAAETTLASIIAGYIADQEDCKHGLVQISSIAGAVTYSHDGTMRWYDYRNDEVLDGALGTKINFPSNSAHKIAPGSVTVTMTAYLYEAREIEIWWQFEKSWYADETDLTITCNTGSTTSRTIRLTQAYAGWNVEHISCPAGVSKITFACSSRYPRTEVGYSGVNFYVVPQSYSMFGDGIICSQCGAVCKHESIGFAYDEATGEYCYVCNETYGCHHKVDLSAIPADQESSFTSARAAYDDLTDEQKALVIPSELLILEKHEAFKSVIENEQAAIQETNTVNSVLDLLKQVPEASEVTVDDKTAIQAARTAYTDLTAEQKALIEQTLLDKLTAAENMFAELKETDDTQKADAVTAVITALPAVDDITFEKRSLIEQARVAYEMLTSDQKAKVAGETKNVLSAAEVKGVIVSWEDFFPEDGTYILVPVTNDTKAMANNIKIAAYNETTINDNLTNNRSVKWKIVRQGGNVFYAFYSIYDATYNNADRLLDAAAWDSSLSDGSSLGLVNVDSYKSEYNTDVFRFSKRKGVDMDTDEYYLRAVSTSYNKYNYVITLRSGDGYNIGTYGAKNDYQVWKLIRVNGDEEFAQVVIDLIDPLPTYADTTLDDEATVVAVRTAYNGLTTYQQNLVTNRDVLFTAEQKIVDIKAANAVDALITAIGEVSDTPESKTKIDTARAAYNALTEAQTLLVVGLDTLEAAETTCAGYVTARINALPPVEDIDVDNTTIAAARAKYEALTAEEKSHVTDETMDKLTASESTLSIISLPEIGVADVSVVTTEKLTLANKPAVVAARTQYNALTDNGRTIVGGFVDTLVAAETEIADLEAAKAVNDAIVALPAIENLTAANKTAVDAAVTAYKALSAYQKNKVPASSVDKLFAEETTAIILSLPAYADLTLGHADAVANADTYLEKLSVDQEALVLAEVKTILAIADKKIADMTAAKAVSDEIGAIGDVEYNAECKAKIDSARANYNLLTGDQKAFLLNDEQNLFEYHYSDLQAKEAEYAEHADEAINSMIDMPVDEITVGDKDDILAAWDTYDDLIDEEKQLLPKDTVDKLFAAVATIEIIEIPAATAIDEDIDNTDADAIKAAKAKYDALTPDQKDLLDDEVVNKVFASATTLTIVELPVGEDIDTDDAADIAAARYVYDHLTEEQQALIPQTTKDTLIAAETVLEIVELPVGTNISEEDEDAIEAARAAYNDLTPEQKEKVPPATVDTLVAAETVLEIVELPVGTNISEEDEDAIEAARAAYNDLTPEQQAKVPPATVDTLVAAETVLEIVELPVGEDISTDDADDIAAAREAYETLTADQKAKVPQATKDTLVAAETVLEIVKLPEAEEIGAGDETAIATARLAYDLLTDDQKDKVPPATVNTLVAAETTLAIVKLPTIDSIEIGNKTDILDTKTAYDELSEDQIALLPQEKIDKLFVSVAIVTALEVPVATAIDEDVADDVADAILAAKAAYDDLSDEQKEMLDDDVKNKVCASASALAIVKLPTVDSIEIGNKTDILDTKTAYDELSEDQIALLPQEKIDKLFVSVAIVTALEVPVAENINDDVTDDVADAILAAKAAYDDLSDEQKDMLDDVDDNVINKVCASASALAIVKLPASDEITADSEEAITAARAAFNDLTPEQQALVPQTTKDTLIAAETDLTIVKLPAIDEIGDENKAGILAAKAAYTALTPAQKAKVSDDNVNKLFASATTVAVIEIDNANVINENIAESNANAIKDAKATYDSLTPDQKALLSEEIVNKVLASSGALTIVELPVGVNISADDATAIAAARAAFDAYSTWVEETEGQQDLIPQTTVDTLVAAESVLSIVELPVGVNIGTDDATDIANARAAYNALTTAQKAKVPQATVDTLIAAETVLEIVELSVGENITADDADDIAAARTAYNTLTADQKAKVPQATVDTLVAAESVLEIVELPVGVNIGTDDVTDIANARAAYNALTADQKDKVPQTTVDTLVAAETTLTIVNLPVADTITTGSEDAITAARAAYNTLTADQKAKVAPATVNTLVASETTLTIVKLPAADTITAGSEDAITAARAAFGNLTPAQQALIPPATVDTLIAAETTLTIVKLPNTEEIDASNKADITAAINAYNTLSDEQKALLPEDIVDKLMASAMTIAIIDIPASDSIDENISDENTDAIKAAKMAYDLLSEEQKAMLSDEVVNKVLSSATTLAIVELPAIGEIDAEDKADIITAKAAYTALTPDQKGLVPPATVDKLFASATTVAVIEIDNANVINENIAESNANAIKDAKATYDSLTPDQKALLSEEIVNKVLASSGALTIVELPVGINISTNDATAIAAARAAFDAYSTWVEETEGQQDLIPQTTVDTLVAAETILEIVELPVGVAIVAENEDAIVAARAAYELLTEDQKAKVPQATVDTLIAAETVLEIVELSVGENITADDADDIAAARTAYNTLTADQKAKVPQATVDTLVAAESVLEIVELPVGVNIGTDDATDIANARAAYNALTTAQKDKVPQTTVDTLVAAESVLSIVELPVGVNIGTDDATDIANARAAYNALTTAQKDKVPQTTVDTLVAAESVLEIVELPVGVNIGTDDATDIANARAAYNALTTAQKDKVPQTTVDTLVAAESVLEIVELPVGEAIVATDATAIADARAAYNALTTAQKDKVPQTTVDTLVAAESVLSIVELPVGEAIVATDATDIAIARAAYNALTTAQKDKVPQTTVDTLVAAESVLGIVKLHVGEAIVATDAAAIADARTAYNALTTAQKDKVPQTTVDTLVAAESVLGIVKLHVGEAIVATDATAIADARAAYNALTTAQKDKVPQTTVDTLVAAETTLTIVELPVASEITANNSTAIADARAAYNALTTAQKDKVPQTTVDTLVAAETTLTIVELPVASEITANNSTAIANARAAYDALSDEQKEKVSQGTVDTLVAAETTLTIVELPAINTIAAENKDAIVTAKAAYSELSDDQKDLMPKAVVDKVFAADTTVDIVRLPSETLIALDDADVIAAARTSYNALSPDQKGLVPQAQLDKLVASETTLTIVGLNAEEDITVSDAEAIASARAEFNAMSDAQKERVPAAIKDKLICSEVTLAIVELPVVIDITAENEDAIIAAKAAYETLSDKQKPRVPQDVVDTLYAADTTLSIVELPVGVEIVADDEDAIVAAREAYETLTADQKAKVPLTTVDTLVAAETVLEIVELPVGVEIVADDEDAIVAAREAYDALTADQKAKVPQATVDTLVAAETVLEIVELPVGVEIVADDEDAIVAAREAYETLTADQKAKVPQATVDTLVAAEIVLEIVELPVGVEIVADDEDDIEAAREAYDALTADQKAKVPQATVDTLVAAETVLEIVELPVGVEIVADDEDAIVAAREAYDALTADQKAKVPQATVDTLVAAETVLEIVELPVGVEIVADDEDSIVAAREAYEALTEEQKAKVPQATVDTLVAAETVLEIVELPATAEITREDQDAVVAARAAYEALTEEQKAKVPAETLAILVAAENIFVAMDKIEAIGEVAYTTESKALIDDAKEYFDALTEDQKAAIDNSAVLQQADTDYNAVDSVFNKIETISDIRYDERSGDAIGTARLAYTSLTAEQKALLSVNSLQKLVDAETVYETLGKIDAIGKVEYSEESKDLIDEARTYYDSLSDEQKALINIVDYETLTESEETYSVKDTSAVATYTSLLVIVCVLLACGLTVLGVMVYLLLKGKKKKGTKTLSVFFFPILLGVTHYIDSPFLALYVLAGLLIVLIAVIIILALKNPFLVKEMKKIVKKEKEPEEKPAIAENTAPETVSATEDEAEDGGVVVDAKGNYFNIRYNKSFTAKLIQSSDETKKYYTALKNEILAYKKTKSSVSWAYDSVNAGRSQVVKFAIRGKTLCVYFALDPDVYAGSKYRVEKAEANKYENVPCMYRVKGDRRAKYAMELIAITSEKLGLTKGEVPAEDYAMPYETTEALLEKGLIKELKIAATEAQIQRAKAAGAIQVVSHVSVQEADEMITDEVAATLIGGRAGGATGKKTIVNVDVLSKNYSDGDTVTIEDLKEKKLIPQSTMQVKLLARGVLDKKLHVKLQDYSIEAVKMILATGGTVKRV